MLLTVASAAALLVQADMAEFRFPLEPVGPHAAGMGGAGVALERDAEAGLNPALVLGAPQLSLYRYEGFADYDGFVAAGHIKATPGLAVGLAFRHFDYGTIIEDDLGGDLGDVGASEQAFRLTAAARPSRTLSIGASVAHLHVNYFGSVTSATLMSLGGLLSYSRSGTVGAALRSVGPSARNKEFGTRYPVPSRLRIGAAQGVSLGSGALRVAADAEFRVRKVAMPDVYTGVEWMPMLFLALRAGLAGLENPDVTDDRQLRWSAGAGITIGRVELGLGARFGGAEGGEELFLGLDAFR